MGNVLYNHRRKNELPICVFRETEKSRDRLTCLVDACDRYSKGGGRSRRLRGRARREEGEQMMSTCQVLLCGA